MTDIPADRRSPYEHERDAPPRRTEQVQNEVNAPAAGSKRRNFASIFSALRRLWRSRKD